MYVYKNGLLMPRKVSGNKANRPDGYSQAENNSLTTLVRQHA